MDQVQVLIETRGNGIRVFCPEFFEKTSKTMSVKAYYDRPQIDWDGVDDSIRNMGSRLGFPAAFAQGLEELEGMLMPDRLLPGLAELAKNRHVQFVLDNELGGIPWHLFTVPDIREYADSAPAVRNGVPVIVASILLQQRNEDYFLKPTERTDGHPVAFVIGSPRHEKYVNVPAECEAVRRELEAAGYIVRFRPQCTKAEFWNLIGQAHALHYAGHSQSREGGGEAFFLLEDGPVTETEITEKFRRLIGHIPSFVMLNSCDSAAYGVGRKVAGLPEVFRALGVRYYVANRWKMPDVGETVEFSRTFYRHLLGGGCIVAEALAIASQSLPSMHKAAPMLFGDGTRTMRQIMDECPRPLVMNLAAAGDSIWASDLGGCSMLRSQGRLCLSFPAEWGRPRGDDGEPSGMFLPPAGTPEEENRRTVVLDSAEHPWRSITETSGTGPERSRIIWELLVDLAGQLDSIPPAGKEKAVALLKDISPAGLFSRVSAGGRNEAVVLADPVIPDAELHRLFNLPGMVGRDVPPLTQFFWRLGVIVYRAWTGMYPFTGESPLGLAVPDQLPLRIRLELPGQNAPRERNYLEEKLLAVVERLMSRSWDRRYASLSAFAADLSLDFGAPEIPGPILREFDSFINTDRISMAIGYSEYSDEIGSLITYAESLGWLIVDLRLDALAAERMEKSPEDRPPELIAGEEARGALRFILEPGRDYAALIEREDWASIHREEGSLKSLLTSKEERGGKGNARKVLLVLRGFLDYLDEYSADLVKTRISTLQDGRENDGDRGEDSIKLLWLDYAPLSIPRRLQPLVKSVTVPFPDQQIVYSFLRRRLPQLWPTMRFSSIIGAVVAACSGLTLSTLGSVLNEIAFRIGDAEMDLNDLAHEVYTIKQRILNEGGTPSGGRGPGFEEVQAGHKRLSEIRGYELLTAWLADKLEDLLKGKAVSLLLLGPTGSGKTEFIRAFSEEAGLATVNVTPTSILGGYVGESEANFRRKLNLARMLAPAVLLVDDAGGFFMGHRTHAVQSGLLSMLSHFIAERAPGVLTVAIQTLEPTAAKTGLEHVPEEFLATGKLDEIFYAGRLPPLELWRYCADYFASWGRGRWDGPEGHPAMAARLAQLLPSEIEKYANDAMFEAGRAAVTPDAFDEFLGSRKHFRPMYPDGRLEALEALAARMGWRFTHLSAEQHRLILEGKESS